MVAHLQVGTAHSGYQSVECCDEVLAALRVLHAHRACHLHHRLLGSLALGKEVEVGMTEHNQTCTVSQRVVITAHHVLHRVLRRTEHVVARQRVGQRHVRASLAVRAVGIGLRQVLGNQFDGLQREHLTHRVLLRVDHALGCVEEGIHALIGRELGRHTHHQVAVNHRYGREHRAVEHTRLLLHLVVRDDREHIHLRARSGTRRDGYQRCHRAHKLLLTTLLREGIVP